MLRHAKMLRRLRPIFTKRQHFEGILGNRRLNAAGLHLARVLASDVTLWLRRAQLEASGTSGTSDDARAFRRDGVVAIEDFFPRDQFVRIRSEVHGIVSDAARRHPYPDPDGEVGFGAKRPIERGFDRFDGGTLNRFLDLGSLDTPETLAALESARLAQLAERASGFVLDPRRFQIYETCQGDEAANPDIQRALHRDTFHSTIKVWIFLEDVAIEDGPFEYVVGSHRIDRRRARWEHRRALEASSPDGDNGGSFRVSDAELVELGLPRPTPFPVRANTLVLADVRGLHRRGDARPGARRLALYQNLRAEPFRPVPR